MAASSMSSFSLCARAQVATSASLWIERAEVAAAGRNELSPLTVRVTHIFRREDGRWRLIHRHGDQVALMK
jgi:ketosteroid isomerase-like protein